MRANFSFRPVLLPATGLSPALPVAAARAMRVVMHGHADHASAVAWVQAGPLRVSETGAARRLSFEARDGAGAPRGRHKISLACAAHPASDRQCRSG